MMILLLNEFLIDTIIRVLKVIFHIIDWILQILLGVYELVRTTLIRLGLSFVLVFPQQLPSTTTTTSSSSSLQSSPIRTIVIVGGNFAGLAALWELVKKLVVSQTTGNNNTTIAPIKIVLLDERDYSEYTPGILRLVCDPNHHCNIAQPLPKTLPKAAMMMTTLMRGGVDAQDNTSSTIQYQFIHGKVLSVIGTTGTGGPSGSNNNNNKVLTYVQTTLNNEEGNDTSSSLGTPTPTTLSYDYLIVATGSAYNAPISTSVPFQQYTYTTRWEGWRVAHRQLEKASRVLILGGGAVGVELAAEIAYHYCANNNKKKKNNNKRKEITILDAQPRLVTNFPSYVGDYAFQWLQKNGVNVLLGQSLLSWNDTSCTLTDGTALEADIVYVCFGNRPNSQPMTTMKTTTTATDSSIPSTPLPVLTGGKYVEVGATLQVQATTTSSSRTTTTTTTTTTPFEDGCIFACGDVANPPSNNEKQAFQAEMQGKLAARNVVRMMMMMQQSSSLSTTSSSSSSSSSSTRSASMTDNINVNNNKKGLYQYPQDLGETDLLPQIFVLSLGPYDGILGFNTVLIPGPLAAIVKWILEYTKVLHMRGEVLGMGIWMIGDAIVLFLNRTVFQPTRKKQSTTATTTTTATTKKKN
jgi:NADH dehydrogenase FAD-containing subunit